MPVSMLDVCAGKQHVHGRVHAGRALAADLRCHAWCECRRQIQLQSTGKVALRSVLHTINQRGAPLSYYRGFVPNAVKNLPNKGAAPFWPRLLCRGLSLAGLPCFRGCSYTRALGQAQMMQHHMLVVASRKWSPAGLKAAVLLILHR